MSFREFIGGSFGNDLNRSQVMLAKEVLAEIPDQVIMSDVIVVVVSIHLYHY